MTHHELQILNALVTYAAENFPGGMMTEEREVVEIVGRWALDGVPVRPVCPHCNSVAPYGEERAPWLELHIDNLPHSWWWNMKTKLKL